MVKVYRRLIQKKITVYGYYIVWGKKMLSKGKEKENRKSSSGVLEYFFL